MLRLTVEGGRDGFLYDSVWVGSGSVVNGTPVGDPFDIEPLRERGLEGWEVVGVVPETVGVSLSNSSIGLTTGTAWGAGMGGNVVGVHILLRLRVSQANLDDARDALEELFGVE